MAKSNLFAASAALAAWTMFGCGTQAAKASTLYSPSFVALVTDSGGTDEALCTQGESCAGPTSAGASFMLQETYTENPDEGSPYSGSAAALASVGGDPSVAATATAASVQLEPDSESPDAYYVTASAADTYYFELTQTGGSAYSGTVPILMTGTSSNSLIVSFDNGDDYTQSSTSVLVTTADGVTTLYNSSATGGFSQDLGIIPGVVYEVQLEASVTAQVGANEDSDESLTSTASIDPLFSVDTSNSTFPGGDQFELSFFGGAGDSAVPEPATCALMLTGLGAFVLMRFRSGRR